MRRNIMKSSCCLLPDVLNVSKQSQFCYIVFPLKNMNPKKITRQLGLLCEDLAFLYKAHMTAKRYGVQSLIWKLLYIEIMQLNC